MAGIGHSGGVRGARWWIRKGSTGGEEQHVSLDAEATLWMLCKRLVKISEGLAYTLYLSGFRHVTGMLYHGVA